MPGLDRKQELESIIAKCESIQRSAMSANEEFKNFLDEFYPGKAKEEFRQFTILVQRITNFVNEYKIKGIDINKQDVMTIANDIKKMGTDEANKSIVVNLSEQVESWKSYLEAYGPEFDDKTRNAIIKYIATSESAIAVAHRIASFPVPPKARSSPDPLLLSQPSRRSSEPYPPTSAKPKKEDKKHSGPP